MNVFGLAYFVFETVYNQDLIERASGKGKKKTTFPPKLLKNKHSYTDMLQALTGQYCNSDCLSKSFVLV